MAALTHHVWRLTLNDLQMATLLCIVMLSVKTKSPREELEQSQTKWTMGKSGYVLVHWPKTPSSLKVEEDESLTWFPSVATEKHISGAADIFI